MGSLGAALSLVPLKLLRAGNILRVKRPSCRADGDGDVSSNASGDHRLELNRDRELTGTLPTDID